VRRIVEGSGLAWSDPAPFEPGATLAEALLRPTRIYVRSCLEAIRTTGGVKALAHITGGGLLENVPRVLPADLAAEIDLAAIPVSPVFCWLARTGPVAEGEMIRTVQLRDRHGGGRGSRAIRGNPGGARKCRRGYRRVGAPRPAARPGHGFFRRPAARVTRRRVAVLISGRGSNLAALMAACGEARYPAEICLVVSNRPEAAGLEFARRAGLATSLIDHRAYATKGEFEARMDAAVARSGRRNRVPGRLHAAPVA
jgi:hypothetical protein